MFLKHLENTRCNTGAAVVSCFLPQDASHKIAVLLYLGGIANAMDSFLYQLYFEKKQSPNPNQKCLAETCMICTGEVKILPQKLHGYINGTT